MFNAQTAKPPISERTEAQRSSSPVTSEPAATDDSESPESEGAMTDDDDEHLSLEELAKAAKHVQKLLKRITMLQKTYDSSHQSKVHKKRRVHKIYQRFCRKWESNIVVVPANPPVAPDPLKQMSGPFLQKGVSTLGSTEPITGDAATDMIQASRHDPSTTARSGDVLFDELNDPHKYENYLDPNEWSMNSTDPEYLVWPSEQVSQPQENFFNTAAPLIRHPHVFNGGPSSSESSYTLPSAEDRMYSHQYTRQLSVSPPPFSKASHATISTFDFAPEAVDMSNVANDWEAIFPNHAIMEDSSATIQQEPSTTTPTVPDSGTLLKSDPQPGLRSQILDTSNQPSHPDTVAGSQPYPEAHEQVLQQFMYPPSTWVIGGLQSPKHFFHHTLPPPPLVSPQSTQSNSDIARAIPTSRKQRNCRSRKKRNRDGSIMRDLSSASSCGPIIEHIRSAPPSELRRSSAFPSLAALPLTSDINEPSNDQQTQGEKALPLTDTLSTMTLPDASLHLDYCPHPIYAQRPPATTLLPPSTVTGFPSSSTSHWRQSPSTANSVHAQHYPQIYDAQEEHITGKTQSHRMSPSQAAAMATAAAAGPAGYHEDQKVLWAGSKGKERICPRGSIALMQV